MTRGVTFLLVSLNVVLAGLLAWLWIAPDGTLRGIHWLPPAAIRPDLGKLSGAVVQKEDADTSRFMAVIDRPVFSPSRRPPPPPPPPKVEVPVPPDPLNTIHLYGLFGGGGGAGGVIARIDGKTRRIHVSEPVGQWTLKEIKPGAVVFTKGAESRTVPIVQAKQVPGAAPPNPAFAAPMAPGASPPPAEVPDTAPAPAQAPVAPSPAPRLQQPRSGGASGTPSSPFVIGGSR